MASTDVFMSSPLQHRTLDTTAATSSSPCLPSLDEIFLKGKSEKPLRTGSQPTPLLATARSTFTNAAEVLRRAPEIDIDTETITSSPPRGFKTPTKGHRRTAPAFNQPLNDQNSEGKAVVLGSLSPRDKPWHKFHTRPSTNDGDQSLLPTNPKAMAPRNQTKTRKTTKTVSRHFATEGEKPFPDNNTEAKKCKAGPEEPTGEAPGDVELEPALPRRADWTPPRASKPILLGSDSDTQELLSSVDRGVTSKDVFRTLHTQYGRQETEPATEPCPQLQTGLLKKRKRIQLVCTGQEDTKEYPTEEPLLKDSQRPNGQRNQGGPKAPAPRKKTRTITELATAPFAAPIIPDFELTELSTKESMLNYFDSDGAVKALVEHQSTIMSQRKPNAKETKQPPKTKRKRKAGTQANPILLSPSSALKQSSNQDFVFGTSSQLMREESPTMLRDLEAAIRASTSLDSDPFEEAVGSRLWHAGARDEDGELIGMDIVDLRNGPIFTQKPDSTATPGGRSFVDIDDILDSPGLVSAACDLPSGSGEANPHLYQSHSAEQNSNGTPESAGPVNAAAINPRPNYELFTDVQLSKQITSYGFKPVKKRAAMIALLDQCWASKYQGASACSTRPLSTSTHGPAPAPQESSEHVPDKAASKPRERGRPRNDDSVTTSVAQPSTSKKQSPERPRGRPKKAETASASTAAASPKRPRGRRKSSAVSVEIPDSENGTPSPVSSPDPVFSSPPPLDLTISDEGDMSLTFSPNDQQAELFKHITKAVTSTPRSQDPSNPSWHEKMLLYDPIILEDLASWLNSGELTRVGYNGEVSPSDVKKWCESKSVICLWRQNTKGRERKRY